MKPDPATVQFWQTRAEAYDRMCRGREIFALLSNRLIDLLPANLCGTVLDIGAGSGLTSELLLKRHARCNSILIEPSDAMTRIARRHLSGLPAQFRVMGLDEVRGAPHRASAAIASASMHFLEFEPAFGMLKQLLAPGASAVFNLWWHHWEETVLLEQPRGWVSIARVACLEAGVPPPPDFTQPATLTKTRAELDRACRAHGISLVAEHRDTYSTPVGVGVDFQAMDPDWPAKGLSAALRAAVIGHMHELANGQVESLTSTRFHLQMPGVAPVAERA
ncbi:MAG: class I SAM-dependent methyltransferase [Phycisphaerae bacterium]|nr:class I SAM-dependent methyltransferase [Phycisphaerae bacterium]